MKKPQDKPDSEARKHALELQSLEKSLFEQRSIGEHLKKLIDDENKKIAQLNEKIENLLHEQKYEIIELVQVISRFNRSKASPAPYPMAAADQNNMMQHNMDNLKQEIDELRRQNQHYKATMLKQSQFIGQYRGSVVFPLYRFTHSFGETPLGKSIQKAIKK